MKIPDSYNIVYDKRDICQVFIVEKEWFTVYNVKKMRFLSMETNFISSMGKRIYELRKELRLSQEELAERADTTKQTISLAEKGKQELRAGNVAKIAEALGVSTDYLLRGIRIDSDHMVLDRRIRGLNNDRYDFLADTINRFVDLCEKTDKAK